MADLTGLHVVVTRPLAQAEPWAERLREMGATTSIVPLLDIVPLKDAEHIQFIKNRILDFDHYSKAIFVSQNAVVYGLEWLENYWPQLPYGIDYFAVGETTAKQLQQRGLPVTDLAQSQSGAMNSETLLQSPALQSVKGEKILIFRGLGGRPHIGEVLSERGAHVDYCELYERVLPSEASVALNQVLARAQTNLVVVVHSGEALENLQRVLSGLAVDLSRLKEQLVLLVPSQRILDIAIATGFKRVHAAQNATELCMLQGLLDVQCQFGSD